MLLFFTKQHIYQYKYIYLYIIYIYIYIDIYKNKKAYQISQIDEMR